MYTKCSPEIRKTHDVSFQDHSLDYELIFSVHINLQGRHVLPQPKAYIDKSLCLFSLFICLLLSILVGKTPLLQTNLTTVQFGIKVYSCDLLILETPPSHPTCYSRHIPCATCAHILFQRTGKTKKQTAITL